LFFQKKAGFGGRILRVFCANVVKPTWSEFSTPKVAPHMLCYMAFVDYFIQGTLAERGRLSTVDLLVITGLCSLEWNLALTQSAK
jgi:hypothetical protein